MVIKWHCGTLFIESILNSSKSAFDMNSKRILFPASVPEDTWLPPFHFSMLGSIFMIRDMRRPPRSDKTVADLSQAAISKQIFPSSYAWHHIAERKHKFSWFTSSQASCSSMVSSLSGNPPAWKSSSNCCSRSIYKLHLACLLNMMQRTILHPTT